jgi:hypothetical protein
MGGAQSLRSKDSADRDREKNDGQYGLMQMVVPMSENDRGQNDGSEFADNRRSEDMPAKVGVEVAAFAENRKEHAEGGRWQNKGDEQRRPQQANGIKQSGEKAAQSKGREPGEDAKTQRRGANLLRVELEPRLEEQEYEAEFTQEPYYALARHPTKRARADQDPKHELQNHRGHAGKRRQAREQRRKDSDEAHDKKSMNLAHDDSFPPIAAASILKRQNARRPLRRYLFITPFCKVFGPNRTKMFHVKHFRTVDGLRKRTFAMRGLV